MPTSSKRRPVATPLSHPTHQTPALPRRPSHPRPQRATLIPVMRHCPAVTQLRRLPNTITQTTYAEPTNRISHVRPPFWPNKRSSARRPAMAITPITHQRCQRSRRMRPCRAPARASQLPRVRYSVRNCGSTTRTKRRTRPMPPRWRTERIVVPNPC